MQHESTYSYPAVRAAIRDETAFQREMRAEGIEPDFHQPEQLGGLRPEEMAGAMTRTMELTMGLDYASPVRASGDSSSFDVRLPSGQMFRIQVEEIDTTAWRKMREVVATSLMIRGLGVTALIDAVTQRIYELHGFVDVRGLGEELWNVAENISKRITLDGRPVSDAKPECCPACRSDDPAVRNHPAGFLCDDPSRWHQS